MREFNMKRPARRSFDAWMADFSKLSGKTDVSQDEEIQEAFAESYALAECADGRKQVYKGNVIDND